MSLSCVSAVRKGFVLVLLTGIMIPSLMASEKAGRDNLQGNLVSLTEIESMALISGSRVKSAEAGHKIYQARKRQHYGRLLPSLSFNAAIQATEKDPGEKTSVSSLSAEVSLPDPWTFQNQGRQVDVLNEKAELETQLERAELISTVRKQYYKILYQQKKVNLKQELLKILQRVFEDTRKRYYSGLIHKLDFQKARLSLIQTTSEIENLNSVLSSDKQKLTELVSGPDFRKARFSLEGYLSDSGQLSRLLTGDFFTGLRQSKSPHLQLQETLLKSASLEAEGASLFYMPDFRLSAEKPTDKKASDGMTFKAGVSWELFSGGRDYYSYREKVASKEKQSHLNEAAKKDWLVRFDSLHHSLILSLSRLELQFNIVKTWEEMITLSSERFSRGLAEYRELSDDLEKFSLQKEKLVDLQSTLWDELIEFSSHCGNSELFRKFAS